MDRAALDTPARGQEAATGGEGGATRSQHVVLTLPYDWGLIPQFLRGPLERVGRAGAAGTQLLVVTPDAETALAVAEAALVGRSGSDPVVVPVTRAERAARQLAARPAAAVAGPPAALAALVRGAALKLGGLRTLVLAWADETLAAPGAAAELETILAEVPRDAARLLVASATTDAVAALVERTMFRARRVDALPRPGEPVALSYVATTPAARPDALRRVLDELDPVTAAVVVATEAADAEARRTLRALGYAVEAAAGVDAAPAAASDAAPDLPVEGQLLGAGDAAFDDDFHGGFGDDADDAKDTDAATGDDDAANADADADAAAPVARADEGAAVAPAAPSVVRVVGAEAVPAHTALAVLYDLPLSAEALDRVAAARPGQIVALAQARQLDALRAIAGGPARPLPLGEAARRARLRDETLRSEVRAELERGLPPRELAVLEPLLAEHDPAEVAAATLRLLDRERARRASPAAAAAAPTAGAGAAPPAFPPSGMTRLFINAGSRDGVRPGDLVGAIAGEAGISSDKLGKIEVRESFSLVEVQSAEAERVVAKVNGIAIRGRRVLVRPERDAGDRRDRPDRDRAGRDRPGRDRPDRGPRPGEFGRGDRAERGAPGGRPGPSERRGGERRGFDTRDGPRTFGGFDDRPAGERAEPRGEWAERAERLRRARRGAADPGDIGDITES